MIGRQENILLHQNLSPATNGISPTSTVFTSKIISLGAEFGWILVVRNGATITGTTPGIIWEVDVSDNGGAFTRVGGAIATNLAVGLLVVPYILNSTQGVMAAYTAGHTYQAQVKGTIGNADNIITDISVDLIAVL